VVLSVTSIAGTSLTQSEVEEVECLAIVLNSAEDTRGKDDIVSGAICLPAF